MKPYYERDGITIYHGDCREILPHVKADCVVTDPPFGMSYCSGWQERPIANDHDTSARDTFLQAWAPKPAVVFGRWDCPRPEGVRARLIWDKGEWPGMGDLQFPWGPSDEEAYVIGDGFAGRRMGTVMRVRRLPGASLLHPNEKPPELLQIILQRCPPGVILDPFMGSGTTLVAAKLEGRKAIGIEIEERYCEIAAKRLAQGVLDFQGEALK
jgi:site-specific DNA-methyltransferase (adenine-specific)